MHVQFLACLFIIVYYCKASTGGAKRTMSSAYKKIFTESEPYMSHTTFNFNEIRKATGTTDRHKPYRKPVLKPVKGS